MIGSDDKREIEVKKLPGTIEGLTSLSDLQKGVLIGMDYDLEKLTALSLDELKAVDRIRDNAEALYQELHPEEDEKTKDSPESEPEQEPEPQPPTREEMIAVLKKLPEVGASMAEKMYDAGIDSLEALKSTKEEKLLEIEGISRSTARRILAGIEHLDDGISQSTDTTEAKGVDDNKEDQKNGFFSGIMSRIKGWLFKKEITDKEDDNSEKEEVKEAEDIEDEGKDSIETDVQETESASGQEKSEDTPETPEAGTEENKSDIKPEDKSVEEFPQEDVPRVPAPDEGTVNEFMKIEGLEKEYAEALASAGYSKLDDLKMIEKEDLELVNGIGTKNASSVYEVIQAHFKE